MSAELEPMQESIAPFDYSQLDEQTAQALQNYAFRALQVARTYYRDLMEIVVGAHELLCGPVVPNGNNSRHGNRGDDTFRAWCASVRINRTKAYQLLQIHSFMDTCTPEEQSTLALLPFTAMRELVTGDTPEQIITMAKEGKVGTYKEVLELKAQIKAKDKAIAAEKERADAAEAQRDAAQADVAGLYEQNTRLKEQVDAAEAREEEAWKLQGKSEAKAKDAETELEAVTADLNGLYDRAAQAEARNTALLDERAEYVQRIKELESRPIEVMHDPEETDRLAHQYAYGIAADMTEELRTKNNQQSQTIAALQKELEAARSTNGYDPQSDLETVCACIGSMEQMWGTALPAYERLSGKDLRTATDTLQDVIGRLYGDMARTAEDGED